LVDFGTFPAKLVELLHECVATAAAPDAGPRCVCGHAAAMRACVGVALRAQGADSCTLKPPHTQTQTQTRSSFQAVLRAPSGGAESTLAVVETNAFKQLTHIALRCRPGNDAAIKQARTRPKHEKLQLSHACSSVRLALHVSGSALTRHARLP
jgi:hypothetical protein